MSDRLPSATLVGALLRRVNDSGGMGTVLARGDAQAGAILIIMSEKGTDFQVVERGSGMSGKDQLVVSFKPADGTWPPVADYWQKRRARDPDLWVIELDSADAERFAAETIATD